VVHKNILTTAGAHTIFIMTDWSTQQPETNENNNSVTKKVVVGPRC
jgi:hypothetical protein